VIYKKLKAYLRRKIPLLYGWAMYDWANSSYALVISSAVFPIFYEKVTKTPDGKDTLRFLGLEFLNTELYSYALALSFLIVAVLSPILSAVADYTGNKKMFMKFFTYLGAFSTMMLFFFKGRDTIHIGLIFSVLASVGFWGSLVFYNAFLPEIVPKEKQDYASALGFTFGYVGSVLLMLFNLSMLMFPQWYGIKDPTLPARISFLSVGLWWILFAQIPFAVLPDNIYGRPTPLTRDVLFEGYKRLWKVLGQLRDQPHLRRFLYAFFLYSFAAQTIFYVAGIFGSKELGLETSKLILTILLVQLVGIVGAMGFAKISEKTGNIKALLIVLSIWTLITVLAFFLDKNTPKVEYWFYFLGGLVGLVMGSVQTLSRSTYSKMLPEDPGVHTTYFSFYDVFEKIAIVLGTFAFGYLEWITGSMKAAILLMAAFFILSGLILYPLDKYWQQLQRA